MLAKEYTIGQVARRLGVTLRALRFYEDKGLLSPRREGTSRFYSDADLARAQKIALYSRAGVGVANIAAIIDLPDARERGKALDQLLERSRHEAIERLSAIGKVLGNP